MDTLALLGSVLGLGFVAGVRLYATVLAIGLGLRFGLIQLTPALSGLSVLAHPYILWAAAAAYAIEFLADKIPWVDTFWDGLHTIIRPLGAAILGATAIGSVDPSLKVAAALLSGGVALSGHSGKAGTRVMVNHSPEPFSNIGLSLAEDGFAFVGTWLALEHPLVMLGIVLAFLALFAWLGPKLFRAIKVRWLGVAARLRVGSGGKAEIPRNLLQYAKTRLNGAEPELCVRCIAGEGIPGLRNSVGYLCASPERAVFVTRRGFRMRAHEIEPNRLESVASPSGLLFHHLELVSRKERRRFYLFQDGSHHANELVRLLSGNRRGSVGRPT